MKRIALSLACCLLPAGVAMRATSPRGTQAVNAQDVIAIDVLLEPDAALRQRAESANARLRADFPAGFALDASHVPHLTLVQRYVRASDLPAIAAAVRRALAPEQLSALRLAATGFDAAPWGGGDVVLTSITVARSPALRGVEERVVDAVQSFAVGGGTASAFVPNADGTALDPQIVRYVESFVPTSSGAHYRPHVTVGLAHADAARRLKGAPFDTLSFTPAGVAIYQLGAYGTARKRLWGSTPGAR